MCGCVIFEGSHHRGSTTTTRESSSSQNLQRRRQQQLSRSGNELTAAAAAALFAVDLGVGGGGTSHAPSDAIPVNEYSVVFGLRDVISVVCDLDSSSLTFSQFQGPQKVQAHEPPSCLALGHPAAMNKSCAGHRAGLQ